MPLSIVKAGNSGIENNRLSYFGTGEESKENNIKESRDISPAKFVQGVESELELYTGEDELP